MNNTDTATDPLLATPEFAGFWIRFGASIIDSIIVIAIIVPLLYGIYGSEYFASESPVQGVLDFVISYLLPLAGTVLFWVYKSATPGKMAVKVKIVDAATGNKPTVQQSLLRYIGYYVSMLPLFLGFLWVIWDTKKQGWHDKMAGTLVIHVR